MDGFDLAAMHKRGMTPTGHVLRTGGGMRIGEAGESEGEAHDHPSKVTGLAAEIRAEEDRRVQMALKEQQQPRPDRVYHVYDTDKNGNEYLADVRERLHDGTTRSLRTRRTTIHLP